jgi:hypothetical protein
MMMPVMSGCSRKFHLFIRQGLSVHGFGY